MNMPPILWGSISHFSSSFINVLQEKNKDIRKMNISIPQFLTLALRSKRKCIVKV